MNVYDFDNTIFSGDSTMKFYLFAAKKYPKIVFKCLPGLIYGFTKFYIFKKGTKTEFKERMYGFLQYCTIPTDVQEFWDGNVIKIKGWYLQQQRSDDLIISASPDFLIKPICTRLSIKHCICSTVNPHTGAYTGVNCWGEEKVRRYKEIYNDETIDNFYSDSYSDTPLAKIALNAFLVKGDKVLPWDFSNPKEKAPKKPKKHDTQEIDIKKEDNI